jgi:hypothetical protein
MISHQTIYLGAVKLVAEAEATAQKCEDRGCKDEAQKVRERTIDMFRAEGITQPVLADLCAKGQVEFMEKSCKREV